jgi:hypothetical protein
MSISIHKTPVDSTNCINTATTINSKVLSSDTGSSRLAPFNVTINDWTNTIVDEEGRPDFFCIALVGDLFGWFRNLPNNNLNYIGGKLPVLKGNQLVVSYDYLVDRFNVSREKIRKGFVKLETLGVLFRKVKNIKLVDGSRINQLYLTIDQDFYNSCFRTLEFDIRADDNRGDLIRKKELKEKDRSIKSNFLENSFEEETQIKLSPKKPQKSRVLQDFYPLNAKDCSELQSLSGRDFSLNATNEILRDMSKRLTDRVFNSRKGFLSYMSTALRYEMRDAVKTSNENFKIKANLSFEESRAEEIENYLTEIEYSPQVSPEWHLKKKLACVLESAKAYNFLKAYRSIAIERDTAKIHLHKAVQLSQLEQEQVLAQVKATYERVENGEYNPIQKIKLIMPKVANKNQSSDKTNLETKQLPNTLWGKVRNSLIGIYGEAIDTSWFSKIEATEDTEEKAINLKAPSEFFKDWMERNYEQAIEQTAQTIGIKIRGLEC